jgi:hypothetical protein
MRARASWLVVLLLLLVAHAALAAPTTAVLAIEGMT